MNDTGAPVITIDGPSGVGKGTMAAMLARHLGWHLLDSGALYRLTALTAIQQNVDPDNHALLEHIAVHLDIEFPVSGEFQNEILLKHHVVTDAIRAENVAMMASKVAKVPEVRSSLLQRQHEFRRLPGLVADGRDMGTVVFKDAALKIFLTASADERAQRRHKQLKAKGIDANVPALLRDIQARDEQDSNRAVAPLKPADDAEIIDTTDKSIEEVFAIMTRLFSERLPV
ncbi:MAG: (d)CMP kinase [Gammaproteobacteria bacterium]|nr:(d)CMP kinase [Gammaproteobacteria bacterium]